MTKALCPLVLLAVIVVFALIIAALDTSVTARCVGHVSPEVRVPESAEEQR